jgi:hypothetical protein
MIRFDSKTLGKVTLKFRHHLPTVEVKPNNDLISMVNGLKVTQGSTECFMQVDDGNDPILEFFGVAHTHPADHYNKETGRKIALERAIECAGLTPSQSREIWAGYYSR